MKTDRFVRGARRLRSAVGRRLRSVRTSLSGDGIRVVYHAAYRAPTGHLADRHRGRKIADYLLHEGCVLPSQVSAPRRASVELLARVHSRDYLESLDRTDALERVFGGEPDVSQATILVEMQRHMVGGTVLAARRALAYGRGGPLMVNLGGGLHHAHREQGGGFCLFNDVAVAVETLRGEGFDGSVLVIDLDLHPGDGTRAIFSNDETVFTLSIHGNEWDDSPAVADRAVVLGPSIGDREYLPQVDRHVREAFEACRPELVFYVAGVDVAFDDALGGWRVTHDGILERDRLVRQVVGDVPLVWVLAGGYGPDAWRHSARSLAALAAGLDAPIPSESDRSLRAFRRIARKLPREVLTTEPGDAFKITEADLLGDLGGDRGVSRFLGYYSKYGIEVALERYGIIDALREAGYPNVLVEIDLTHSNGHAVRVVSDDARRDLLVELVLRETNRDGLRLLRVEWMLLQNPRVLPKPGRPLLPGQEHPGLGISSRVIGMLLMSCERLGFDGLVFNPGHYHIAAVARGRAQFLDPPVEAGYRAARQALDRVGLADATKAVDEHRVVHRATGEPWVWAPEAMVLPVSDRLEERLADEQREDAIRAATPDLVLAAQS